MCRRVRSAHGRPSAKNWRSRKSCGIVRKTRNPSARAPLSNVQHPRNRPEGIPHRPGGARWEAGPARIPREAAPPHRSPAPRRRSGEKDSLSLSHQKGLGGGVGHLLRPPRRDVHFALENNGWSCTFECEVHVWAPETSGGVGRVGAAARGIAGVFVTAAAQPAAAPGEGAWRRRLVQICCKDPGRAEACEKKYWYSALLLAADPGPERLCSRSGHVPISRPSQEPHPPHCG